MEAGENETTETVFTDEELAGAYHTARLHILYTCSCNVDGDARFLCRSPIYSECGIQVCCDRSSLSPESSVPNGLATYLPDYCAPISDVAGRRRLGLTAVYQVTVARVRPNTFSSRAFASARPTVWNSLPEYLRNAELYGISSFDVT